MPSLALYQTNISLSAFVPTTKPPKAKNKILLHPTKTKLYRRHKCRASPSSSWTTEFDLYELLGVDSSSDQLQIKAAYRSLQKRCHPDIAGPAGHDMAIVLNEIYSILSDPTSRSAYDRVREQAKVSELREYTGKPVYSTWFGSENEQRAVFVDEVRCVGCLKCALFASKTFAIESVYGRARVVGQWADPEEKIADAIQTCPVDCISIVERSNLAALEYLMSKQPRGHVRMTASNTGGLRVSNIFADVSKFQSKFYEMKDKASRKESKMSDLQREYRISAFQGIRSITNWWYQQSHTTASAGTETSLSLAVPTRRTTPPNTERLRVAAAKRKEAATAGAGRQSSMSYERSEEYWTPNLILPSPSTRSSTGSSILKSESPPGALLKDEKKTTRATAIDKGKGSPLDLKAPVIMAVISASVVGFRGGEMSGGGLKEHVGGTVALKIVNSSMLQVLLAGVTWFVIGMIIVGIFEAVKNKEFFRG